ncbi:MAG: hypothetical protein ACPHA0_02555, partial [Candidatus Poseidoniaceae archaeon]
YNDLYSGFCREVLAKAYFSQEKKDDAFNEIGEALEFTRKIGFVACELKLLRTKLEMEESSGIDSISTKQRISEIESKFGE